MENKIIEATIEINAPLNKVWSVFTNPDITKQMGGYYDTVHLSIFDKVKQDFQTKKELPEGWRR